MERVRSRLSLTESVGLRKVASAPLLPTVARPSALYVASKQSRTTTGRIPFGKGSRVVAAGFVLLLVFHFAGFLFAPGPNSTSLKPAWTEMERQLNADIAAGAAAAAYRPPDPRGGTRRIPRVIHHLYNGTRAVDPTAAESYRRWRSINPGWELRFYDIADAADHVKRWAPEYSSVWRNLRRETEREDLFRYLAVLQNGGIFAHAGAVCPRPLDEILLPEDSLVVAWDREWQSVGAALERCYVRRRQVQHRVFAAAPGHPVLQEALDRIAASLGMTFSHHDALDVAERTGAGLFTSLVLKHASTHPPDAAEEDAWSVRLLPRALFGAPALQNCSLTPVVGSAQDRVGNAGANGASAAQEGEQAASMDEHGREGRFGEDASSQNFGRRWGSSPTPSSSADSLPPLQQRQTEEPTLTEVEKKALDAAANLLVAQHEERRLYPVSADFVPPFDVMTHLIGHGERHSRWDVSAALTTFGTWQPSVQPTRRPSLTEALVGSLGLAAGQNATGPSVQDGHDNGNGIGDSVEEGHRGSFVDVGAGYGFLTLAAAARGHRVHAFELGPASVYALNASIARNGFQHLITLHADVALGAMSQRGPVCLDPFNVDDIDEFLDGEDTTDVAPAITTAEARSVAAPKATDADPAASPTNRIVHRDPARGYGPLREHRLRAPQRCLRSVERVSGVDALPENERIAALRVSVDGWEGHVIEGFMSLLVNPSTKPDVIAVEWNPTAMISAGYGDPLKLVRTLVSLGYGEISHSGFICDERWYSITYGVRRRGGRLPEDMAGLKQPTWCRLEPEDYEVLLERAAAEYPEMLLFVHRKANVRESSENKTRSENVAVHANLRAAEREADRPQTNNEKTNPNFVDKTARKSNGGTSQAGRDSVLDADGNQGSGKPYRDGNASMEERAAAAKAVRDLSSGAESNVLLPEQSRVLP